MSLTTEQVKRVAHLARIRMGEEEILDMQHKLTTIFEWIDQLQQLDVSAVNLHEGYDGPIIHERDDVVTSLNRLEDLMGCATKKSFDMYCVAKMVE